TAPGAFWIVTRHRSASPLHSRGLTISSSEPNSFADRIGGRFTPGSWQSSLSRSLLGTPRAVEDHAMQSAAFQGGASCIKDSEAFSFDEPQVCITATRSRPKPHAAMRQSCSQSGSEGDLCLDPVRRALPLVLRVVTAVEDRTTQGRCDPCKEPSLPSKEAPPASKTRRRLVLMNHRSASPLHG